MKKANLDVRERAASNGVMLWEIAERYGCNDGNFSRKLRRELSDEDKLKIFGIIEEIKSERGID